MIIQAHQLKEDGVVWSDDKDLCLTPYLYFDQELGVIESLSNPVGYLVKKYTPAGALKIWGRGVKFFWCQMLMGDSADHVKGISRLNGKLCGKDGAFQALENLNDEASLSNFVVSAYRENNQNVLAEAWMLWLLRHPKDSAYLYLLDCGLTPENLAYVKHCAKPGWFLKPGWTRDIKNKQWHGEPYEA